MTKSTLTLPFTLPKRRIHKEDFCAFCYTGLGLAPHRIERDIEKWLDEDEGSGDVTMFTAFENSPLATFFIVAKEDFVLCGLSLMAATFFTSSRDTVKLYSDFSDGTRIRKGDVVLAGKGPAGAILLAERVALNLSSHLSGIATKSALVADRLQQENPGKAPTLLETRKTTPGLRIYEKYATRTGGARNHRHGLDSGAMLKENHLRSAGGITSAVEQMKSRLPVLIKLEVEVTNFDELREALKAGADLIMLDNFSLDDLTTAVKERNILHPAAMLEISGNLDRADLSKLANSGVDYASMGGLIHKSVWVDMSLQLFMEEGS